MVGILKMDKKLLLFLLLGLSIIFVGCSKETAEKPEEKPKTEIEQPKDTNTENKDENKEETPKAPGITDEDIKIIQESVKEYTVATSLEGLTDENIKAYFGNGSKNDICLVITVEKSLDELMKYWNTDTNGVVEKIERSLVFDAIKDNIKGELSYNDYQYITIMYEDNNTMYAVQQFEND
jgi:PBP1b-binding outer membrane lipoprotein LpoB